MGGPPSMSLVEADVDVAASERLVAGVVRDARHDDPVPIAGIVARTAVLDPDPVLIAAGAVHGRGPVYLRRPGALVADDRVHGGRLHVGCLQRAVVLILLLARRDRGAIDLRVAAERSLVAVERGDPAAVVQRDLAADRADDAGALA